MVSSVLAVVLLLVALSLPDRPADLGPAAFLRLPVEALLGAVLLLLLPRRPGRVVAAVAGGLLGVLVLGSLLDLGFWTVLSRPFDPVLDGTLLGNAVEFVSTSLGRAGALACAVGAGILAIGAVALLTGSAVRAGNLLHRGRAHAGPVVAALATAWVTFAVLGTRVGPGLQFASDAALTSTRDRVEQVQHSVRDRQGFARESGIDAFGSRPGDRLLTALRGKDVMIAFVESYGRSALDEPQIAPGVRRVLATGEQRLRTAGFTGRSAYLTSPTAGGGSWLAHSTLLSGLWIDDQQRYHTLVAGHRLTLPGAFRRAGWRTVGVMPGVTRAWPEGAFYDLDTVYDSHTLGYRGPHFSWAPMPDQYTLAAFRQRELLRPDHRPLLTWIPLVSSHGPWAPLPAMTSWNDVGDGAIFTAQAASGVRPDDVWPDPGRVRAAYGRSVQYSLTALLSFVETYGDDRTVLIVLGDHQPASIVTGAGASRDVPITIIARDPRVEARIAEWGWKEGLTPGSDAPVWRMDAFRDRFLTTFSPSS